MEEGGRGRGREEERRGRERERGRGGGKEGEGEGGRECFTFCSQFAVCAYIKISNKSNQCLLKHSNTEIRGVCVCVAMSNWIGLFSCCHDYPECPAPISLVGGAGQLQQQSLPARLWYCRGPPDDSSEGQGVASTSAAVWRQGEWCRMTVM